MELNRRKNLLFVMVTTALIFFAGMMLIFVNFGLKSNHNSVFATELGSWTSGDCSCVLTDDGVFTISKVSGDGEMADSGSTYGSPWNEMASSILRVVINDGVTLIGDFSFSQCTNLVSVTIPDSVTTIRTYAFSGCSSLVDLNNDYATTNVHQINWPSTCNTIETRTFVHCSAITRVNIPANVTKVYNTAFGSCTNLSVVYCEATTPPTFQISGKTGGSDDDSFYSTANDLVIYVPIDSVELYEAATMWGNHTIQAISSAPAPQVVENTGVVLDTIIPTTITTMIIGMFAYFLVSSKRKNVA